MGVFNCRIICILWWNTLSNRLWVVYYTIGDITHLWTDLTMMEHAQSFVYVHIALPSYLHMLLHSFLQCSSHKFFYRTAVCKWKPFCRRHKFLLRKNLCELRSWLAQISCQPWPAYVCFKAKEPLVISRMAYFRKYCAVGRKCFHDIRTEQIIFERKGARTSSRTRQGSRDDCSYSIFCVSYLHILRSIICTTAFDYLHILRSIICTYDVRLFAHTAFGSTFLICT